MTDAELRGLQERVALIKDMSDHPGWAVAIDRALATLYLKQRQIIQGRVSGYDEYLKVVAWCEGLGYFMTIPEMVEKELEVELQNREEE